MKTKLASKIENNHTSLHEMKLGNYPNNRRNPSKMQSQQQTNKSQSSRHQKLINSSKKIKYTV